MTLRAARIALVCAVALYCSFVVFNNLFDYDTNFQFVRHVLLMDTTFPGNHSMWRALSAHSWPTIFYFGIIVWETTTALLCWWGASQMLKAAKRPAAVFHQSKNIAIAGLVLGSMLWLVAFLAVGGEWFLMWQSKLWNGQETAARLFVIFGIALLFVAQPDSDGQP
jgi:predicted small integral membrane protein